MATRNLSQKKIEQASAELEMAKRFSATRISTNSVLLVTGWSSATLYRRIANGQFPSPVEPGKWHGGSVLECLQGACESRIN